MGTPKQTRDGKEPVFTREDRVDLFRLVLDLFPPPTPDWADSEVGGGELCSLKDSIERALHRLPANYENIEKWFEHFVLSESDEELLTLIELMPYAQAVEDERKRRDSYGRAFQDSDTGRKVREITACMNAFFERTASRARFDGEAHLNRQPFAVETPPALRQLPGQDALFTDIGRLLKNVWPISVLFIDLDDFKAVNDQFGHQAGDRCLEVVVENIGRAITNKGRLYRYGGDEFAMVLPNSQVAEAAPTAERIRLAIERTDPGDGPKMTVSIGVVCSEQVGVSDARALVEAADKAAYASKSRGKNCITAVRPKAGLGGSTTHWAEES